MASEPRRAAPQSPGWLRVATSRLVLNATLQWELLGALPTTMAHGNATFVAWPLRNFEAILTLSKGVAPPRSRGGGAG